MKAILTHGLAFFAGVTLTAIAARKAVQDMKLEQTAANGCEAGVANATASK